MTKSASISTAIFACFSSAIFAFAGVTVTSPSNNSTVGTSVKFVATATASGCSKGVASMGIYPQAFQLAYVTNGASLNTNLNLNPGSYAVVVQEWDNCGGASHQDRKHHGQLLTKTGVYVTSPANKSTVGSPVNFSATATSSCSLGVASMGIYTSPSKLAYVVNGASLDLNLTLSPGTYNTDS